MDLVNWILVGVNSILLVFSSFVAVRYWNRSEEDIDKDQVKKDQAIKDIENDIEKNKEDVSTFRRELGVLSNDVVNKVQQLKEGQDRIERQLARVEATQQSIEVFLREHLLSEARGTNAKRY